LKGDLNNPTQLTVRIAPVLLENVRATVNLKKDGAVIKGPVSLDLRATLFAEGQNLRSSNISAQADLSSLQISMGDKLAKPVGSPVKLDIATQQKGQKISIQKGSLILAAGTVLLTGEVQNPQAPALNLALSAPKLALAQVAALVPMLKPMGLSGTASGNLNVRGIYDFKKGYEKSPLQLTGSISAEIPQFAYKPAKPVATPKPTENAADTPPPEPLLPDWPVARQAVLKTQVKIASLTYDTIPVSQINWSGTLDKGKLKGEVTVGKVFDGSVKVTELSLDLAESRPTTKTAFLLSGLNVGPAFDWAFPSWKGLLRGLASGAMSMSVAHPSRKDFVEATAAKGEVTLKNGFVSTVKFDQMANEIFKKIPSLSAQKLDSKGATADIEGKFVAAKGVVSFSSLHIKTPERNELQAKGWAKVDKTIDMSGDISLSNVQVSGEAAEVVAANSDSTGRFVVPVRITGNAFSPELNLTEETVKKIVTKTAEYKANRFKRDAEAKAKEAAQKEIDKGKQKVQEELQKGLKGIFGK
ncbi:MAG TPA: hypothetical protein VFV50_00110, partial [Bdellovibrionales bacterium]|nr:hypothetical protein [Bdellovibrionales bacterium]